MKKLKCEICGSSDVLKQDSVFTCEACGCKYSLEEAKKLIVEIVNPVQVVGVDNADTIYNRALDWLRLQDKRSAINVLRDMTKNFPGDVRGWAELARLDLNPGQDTIDNAIRLGDNSLLSDLAEAERKREAAAQTICDDILNGRGEKYIASSDAFTKFDPQYDSCNCIKDLLTEGRSNAKYFNDSLRNISDSISNPKSRGAKRLVYKRK